MATAGLSAVFWEITVLTGEWKGLMIKWGHLNMKEETTAGAGTAKYWGGPNMV